MRCTATYWLCVGAITTSNSVDFYSPCRHPTEPTCTYDPVDGLILISDTENNVDKVRLLESQICEVFAFFCYSSFADFMIAELKLKLQEAQNQVNTQQRRQNQVAMPPYDQGSYTDNHTVASSMSPPERPPSSTYPSPSPPHIHSTIVLPRASLNISSDNTDVIQQENADYTTYGHPQATDHMKMDPFMDLLFMGWNPDLPDPVILSRLLALPFVFY